ncbi:MAG: Sulfhydrogenase 2 subunit gamma [Candidatus Woesearchaeota archaeon]|nr:Sulfhydrogenase 2 subunit gamma [Candidatus Woesearchaeota archaeon]
MDLYSLLYEIGRLSGLIGFLFLSILIISGDTARFFDRFFGMDKIIKFQRKFSLATAMFVLFHPVFFIIAGVLPSYFAPNFIFPLILGIISFLIFIFISIASKLYKRISYSAWQYIHILIYLLFFFSLYHAIKIGSDSSFLAIKVIYGTLFVFFIIGIIYRTNYKFKQRKNKFYVKGVKWETKDTFTLIVEPQQKFSFKSGQFCFLRLNRNKLYARHPFTISSAPEDKYLNFTIKNTGRFTQVASELKEGEEVIIDGPFGIFTLEDIKKDLVFIAGGVGITPFMSMIEHIVGREAKNDITLLYGSKTRKDIIFKNKLESIKKNWLKKVFVLSGESSDRYEEGYIDKEIIEKYVKDTNNAVFYICGPELMKKKVINDLKDLGIKKNNIKIESFFW